MDQLLMLVMILLEKMMSFLHAGMQRNVIEIRDSGGNLLNSLAGFAPGAI